MFFFSLFFFLCFLVSSAARFVSSFGCSTSSFFKGCPPDVNWATFDFPSFAKKFPADYIKAQAHTVIKALEQKSGNAKLKIGTVGFCWGSLTSLLLASEENVRISAGAACHPSHVRLSQFLGLDRMAHVNDVKVWSLLL